MGKTTIDSVSSIDIRKLKVSDNKTSILITYGFDSQTIRLTKTPCNYGGYRSWFLCPGCCRRVAVLYLKSYTIKCRNCHDLVYNCERESALDRRYRKADKIRERLGWQPGILNQDWRKPKGKHWKTFFRLVEAENVIAQSALITLNQWIVKKTKKLKPNWK